MTARWVVEVVGPERDLNVTFQPISLLVKNQVEADSDRYPRYRFTHNLLRVMESVRAEFGDEALHPLYWELGRRVHHDRDLPFDPSIAVTAAGFEPGHAAAFDDPSWDGEIVRRMSRGLDLAGDDIGTPIIGFEDPSGTNVGVFGPVITRVPPKQESLSLWDAVVTLTTAEGFWELKRTRTERPDFGAPPLVQPFGRSSTTQ